MSSSFIAPELVDAGVPQDISGYDQRPSWDVAVRFQDLKRLGNIPDREKQKLKARAIEGILSRARQVLGPVLKPEKQIIIDYKTFLEKGSKGEIDLLSTLDEELSSGSRLDSHKVVNQNSLRFDSRIEKDVDIALIMDTSLSMTGEKIALLAVSVAVVALCVPAKKLSLMGFDSKIRWVKTFDEESRVEDVIGKILELPAGGFTNLELALVETSRMLQARHKPNANVVLISDGKYTEGSDPSILARHFRHLNVLKIGRDQAGRDLLIDLSSGGNGRFFEARKISDLPRTMYGAMKSLLR